MQILKLKPTPAIGFQRQWKVVHSFGLQCSRACTCSKWGRVQVNLRVPGTNMCLGVASSQAISYSLGPGRMKTTASPQFLGLGSSFDPFNILKIQGQCRAPVEDCCLDYAMPAHYSSALDSWWHTCSHSEQSPFATNLAWDSPRIGIWGYSIQLASAFHCCWRPSARDFLISRLRYTS